MREAGLSDVVSQAAKSNEPQAAFLEAVATLPDTDPLEASVMAPVFAMLGNAEAIARYSMSINDLLQQAAKNSDPERIRQAISIDACVLTLPVVIAQIRVAQMVGDTSVGEYFSSALRGPDKRRFVYTRLRWTEYLLREMRAFDECTEGEIHDLVVHRLRLYDDDLKKGDSKKALFALFRKWRKSTGN